MDRELFKQKLINFVWDLEDLEKEFDFDKSQMKALERIWEVINKYRKESSDK